MHSGKVKWVNPLISNCSQQHSIEATFRKPVFYKRQHKREAKIAWLFFSSWGVICIFVGNNMHDKARSTLGRPCQRANSATKNKMKKPPLRMVNTSFVPRWKRRNRSNLKTRWLSHRKAWLSWLFMHLPEEMVIAAGADAFKLITHGWEFINLENGEWVRVALAANHVKTNATRRLVPFSLNALCVLGTIK